MLTQWKYHRKEKSPHLGRFDVWSPSRACAEHCSMFGRKKGQWQQLTFQLQPSDWDW